MSSATKIDRFALRVARKSASPRAMPDQCYVQVANTETADARGFASQTPTEIGPFPCRMDGQASRHGYETDVEERPMSGRLQRVMITAYSAGGTPIQIGTADRLRVVARGARPEQLVDIQQVVPREGVMTEVLGLVITN